MDPFASVSVCRLHPGVAVTGFCPACLRDRLAGLHPPSAADLRRCKSFSYARSAAAVEPQRRSCDLFRHGQPIAAAVQEEEEEDHHQQEPGRSHSHQQPKKSSSLGGLLGKKLQQWRRKSKKEPVAVVIPVPLPEMEMPARHRPSCDADPRQASWDARSGPVPALGRLPASMLSLPVEEDEDYDDSMAAPPAVPRSDGQIPVEEDYCYYYDNNINAAAAAAAAVPGGSVQTRDYYLDSSSSSRRRRSVDRSTTSGRNSFSDANNSEATCRMMMMNVNARVSPAGIAAERLYHYHEAHHHHHQSVLVHHQYCSREDEEELQQQGPNNLRADDFSGSFGSGFPFRDGVCNGVPASKPNKKGIKGWSIWGLISKKSSSSSSSSRKYSAEAAAAAGGAGGGGGGDEYEYPWPELRARGYNGQMLRCNSSLSARSSLSGTGIGSGNLSGRRSISGVEMRDAAARYNNNNGGFRTRRDEVLLERNLSTTRSPSYSRSGHHDLDPAMAPQMGVGMGMQYHQQQQLPPPTRRSSSNSKHEFSSLPAKAKTRRSTLGL
ncbi:unnamed protein product [Miscanthus lutarioriparius]|uniref:Uncharacterized protein n=1 Tax=Miscanthus lutarioriparius TaxID=422564 RepID=A0A811Q909_9POAL|nr:unnamed protein product [Miscanthus lutarioriparius]